MYIYRIFPTGSYGGSRLPPVKSLLIPPTWKNPPSRLPLPTKVNCLPLLH